MHRTDPEATIDFAAGRLGLTIQRGEIRSIRSGDIELVRGVYGAVRDADWRTIIPRFDDYRSERSPKALRVTFQASHDTDEVGFRWLGLIEVSAGGRVSFEMHGCVTRPFWRHRIGLCILHPRSLAGCEVRARTPWGTTRGQFPRDVTALSPFANLTDLGFRASPGLWVDTTFTGDLFEMEDQRNWTDPSFKTFGTPLALPSPILVEPGHKVSQGIDIHVVDRRPTGKAMASRRAWAEVDSGSASGLPSIGFETEVGRGSRDVSIPWAQHRSISVTPQALDDARGFAPSDPSGEIEVTLVASADDPSLADLLDELLRWRPNRVIPFDPVSHLTEGALVQAVRAASVRHQVSLQVGGGSRANLAELNMAILTRRLPLADLDFVSFAISAQVHAHDDLSVMQTIDAHPVAVESVRCQVPGMPIRLVTVGLRHAYNPDAAMSSSMSIPPDPRGATTFGGAWWLGSLVAAAQSRVASVTYRGFAADADRGASPTEELAQIIFMGGRTARPLRTSDPTLAGVSIGAATIERVLIANLDAVAREVELALPDWTGATMHTTGVSATEALPRPRRGRTRARLEPFAACILEPL